MKTLIAIVTVLIIIGVITTGVYYYINLPKSRPSSSPTPTPTSTLLPLPYAAYNLHPEPNSTNVLLTTNISVTFSRPPQIVEINLNPEVEISNITKEIVSVASGKFTFHLAEPLKPETTYTVTVIYGQEKAPEGFKPISSITWNFTTAPRKDIWPSLCVI